MRAVTVDAVTHAHVVLVPQRLADRVDVGEPADLRLQLLVGVRQHLRVEPEPGHDEVRRAFHGAALAPDVGPGEVDPPVDAVEGGADGMPHVVEREVEVAGEQVASARRQQRERRRRAAEDLGDGADGAVAAGGDDHVRAGLQRLLRLAAARVRLGRLEPEGLRPVDGRGLGGDRRAQRIGVDLHGVEDHGGETLRLPGR